MSKIHIEQADGSWHTEELQSLHHRRLLLQSSRPEYRYIDPETGDIVIRRPLDRAATEGSGQ